MQDKIKKMRILFITVFNLLLIACKTISSEVKVDENSYWLSLKDSFHLQKANDFKPDSALVSNFYNNKLDSSFRSTKDKILDSIYDGHYYLYSWQRHDNTVTAYTILAKGFGECFEIRLLTFDKYNKLKSNIIIAKMGLEPGSYQYKTETHFNSPDTFLTRHTKTFLVDQVTLRKLSRPIGDTFWVNQFFDKKGNINSQIIDSNFTSKKYKNREGFVIEKILKTRD